MARFTAIGELYAKNGGAFIARIVEDESGRMFQERGGYIGATLADMFRFCSSHGLTYQFAFGDMPEQREPSKARRAYVDAWVRRAANDGAI